MKSFFQASVLAMSVAATGCMTASTPLDPSSRTVGAGEDWPVHGGDTAESHYSRLIQIGPDNVAQLGPAWSFDYDTQRGQEGEPIVVSGVMYISTAWSKVYALDARSGKQLWKYDPHVPGEAGPKGCCDVVNRGVAVDKGSVFVATFDGRLVSLDAATGKENWVVDTIIDHAMDYTSTGAPRVAKGKVFIGNGGAERGVRGYVTAYDAATGAKAWRFFLVPSGDGKPDGEASDEILDAKARSTWSGDLWKKTGGGGAAWDAIVYDEELDQLYIGGGNGSPHSWYSRSGGEGDNLFLGSVVAVDPDSGAYLWHYQETPEDSWDYTSVQPMILTDLAISGKSRKVILHAPKNGFFYVIDRSTGVPVSARPYVEDIRWATGIDPETWRPIQVKGNKYIDDSFLGSPHVGGAHNWQPMAFSPRTGLVYIPTTRNYFRFNVSTGPHSGGGSMERTADMPAPDAYLQALDPVTGKQRWRVDANGWKPDSGGGGVLATASNLVFQGRGDITGELLALDAATGKVLWRMATPNAVMAAPVSYMIDGEQYVAVSTGGGGGGNPLLGSSNPPRKQQPGRMIVFKLGGKATLPPAPPFAGPATDPKETFDPAKVAEGARLYGSCLMCHGINGQQSNIITDLRRSPIIANSAAFKAIVHDGAYLATKGMPKFAGRLTADQVEAIRQYMGAESQKLAADQRAGKPERWPDTRAQMWSARP